MQPHSTEILAADCCIVGGGPAGLMLGYLFARAGLRVVVIEKHADFLHDFRGDTIHPSTLEIMAALGLLEGLLKLPHQRAEKLEAEIAGQNITMADFSRLPVQCRFIAFMPQWDFLNFLAAESARYPGFTLLQSTAFEDFLYDHDSVSGVIASRGDQQLHIRCKVVIGADGRHSQVRARAALTSQTFGVARDVIWFRLSKQPDDPVSGMGHKGPRQNFIVIDRGDYWQCGLTIPKGEFETKKAAGLETFLAEVAAISPFGAGRINEITHWDQFKLLSIRIDRLDKWARPGVLCIGDAAHAMSPIGGVGVNLAIQDAVATANLLTGPLLAGELTLRDLEKVQQRRQFPTVATQFLQIKMSRNKARRKSTQGSKIPAIIRRLPFLRFVFGRLIGLGFRTETPLLHK
ncbi:MULTISPECIES: FAD-dependent oxidoreductase [Pantoea]|uniref:FAD-dependent oxidoreductase n=1 Tax=Pantoea TaxID=53335 RepID=UPI001F3F1AB1|nr:MULTISPECIES: FAD-dependent oxidoreductase [Pantoea]UIL54431.1 FAD-dependent oxidoreductase [Pantoea agglomerans]